MADTVFSLLPSVGWMVADAKWAAQSWSKSWWAWFHITETSHAVDAFTDSLSRKMAPKLKKKFKIQRILQQKKLILLPGKQVTPESPAHTDMTLVRGFICSKTVRIGL